MLGEQVLAERNSHDQLEALRRGELDLGFIHASIRRPRA